MTTPIKTRQIYSFGQQAEMILGMQKMGRSPDDTKTGSGEGQIPQGVRL